MGMLKNFKLGSRMVGRGERPFYIAEMSGNHNQSLEKALAIVDAAAKSGCDALKIQTYTADTMTLPLCKNEFLIEDKDSLWAGKTLYELYQEASTPYEWHAPIKKRCEEHGVSFFSTPFDLTAVDFLEDLGVDYYKIASFENTDKQLIEYTAKTKKPLIISTGMASVSELSEMVSWVEGSGGNELVLLKCTSAYPALPSDAHLATIPHMRDMLNIPVGLSDHTLGIGVAVASTVLGAAVIEKHFTLDRSEGGVDSAFSLEPQEFSSMVTECNRAFEALGEIRYKRGTQEQSSTRFKRSLYVAEDVSEGETFDSKNIRSIRPGLGLAPKHFDDFLGKKASRSISKGTPLSWDMMNL
jgi:pseudaminic acid synthase